jgi:lysophospholipase L1-like esterase
MSTRIGTQSVGVATLAVLASAALQLGLARLRCRRATVQFGTIDELVGPGCAVLADARPIELVALGDSGMAGVGVSRRTDALPCQLAQRVAARTGRPVHVVSHGRAGARTRDVLVDQLGVDDSATADVVVLLIGTNNVLSLRPLHRLATDTTNVLAALARIGAPVVMSRLPAFGAMRAVPGGLLVAASSRAAAVRRLQLDAVRDARGAVELVDVRALVGRRFTRERALMSPDRFHPSADGYALIAEALAPAVVAAVSDPMLVDPAGTSAGGRTS